MARPSQLSGRLLAVLDERRSRSRVTRRAALALEAATLLLVLPLAAFTPWSGAAKTSSPADHQPVVIRGAIQSDAALHRSRADSSANAMTARTKPISLGASRLATGTSASVYARGISGATLSSISIAPPSVGAPPVSRIARTATCSGRGRNGNTENISNSSSDDGRLRTWMANFYENGCSYRVNALGDIAFNRDATDVTKITPGGYFEIEERDGDSIRRAEIRPLPSGELQRRFTMNGTEQPWNAEASAWLAETLVLLERRTAFAADSRVPALLERGGVDAVLKETSLITSEYAKRRYFSALLKNATLPATDVQRVVRQAATEMHSDYEMTELLITMSKQPAFDPGAHVAYAEGISRIKSDYEKRRAMTALLTRDKLGKDVVRSLLQSTGTMSSDYELAEFLISVAKRYPPEGETQKYYLDALARIKSDYERRRVLTAVTSDRGLDGATSAAALQAAGGMRSDYEKAEMLITVAKRGSIDQAARASFLDAAKTIGSPYEKHRVLSALLAVRPLPKETVMTVLEMAPTLRSDYELSELLISIAHATTIDDTLRPAYLKSAESIKGEYEYGRAMSAIRGSTR